MATREHPEILFNLKALSPDSIASALTKAERYRLLNEPRDAESICRDVLRTEPEHQSALVTMLLSLSDQFGHGVNVNIGHAQQLLPRLRDEYERCYYAGVICERWAKAQLESGTPGYVVFDWFSQAMTHYEQAEALRPAGNDDPILRWNACARMIKRHDDLEPRPGDKPEGLHQDDVPVY